MRLVKRRSEFELYVENLFTTLSTRVDSILRCLSEPLVLYKQILYNNKQFSQFLGFCCNTLTLNCRWAHPSWMRACGVSVAHLVSYLVSFASLCKNIQELMSILKLKVLSHNQFDKYGWQFESYHLLCAICNFSSTEFYNFRIKCS